ncbi:GMC family oxidoreductase N-terminal domain-containing protein [Cupriavidus basilensis]
MFPWALARLIINKAVNWTYHTEPVPQLFDRRLYMARGQGNRGCGAINGMVHVRGQPGDFEQWRDSGCDGWGWSDVLPYFKRSEDHYLGDTSLHGKGGPVGRVAAAGALSAVRSLHRGRRKLRT